MDFVINILIFSSIFSILAMGLNYVFGYAGILSVAQGAFMGIGAYVTAILTKTHDVNFFIAILLGILVSAVVAYLLSFPVLRLEGDSLMLVTFGFAIIIFNIFQNWTDLTNGALGIKGIPAPELFGFKFNTKLELLILALILALIVFLILSYILKSPYGTVLKGVRENRVIAQASGHNSTAYARSAFVLGSSVAAVAGSLFAVHISFIEPIAFDLMRSVFVLIMIIIGGLGNLRASIVGAVLIIVFPEMLRLLNLNAKEFEQIFYGLIMVLLMYYKPEGLFGKYKI
jgi:branched-chain amino acid transport system permease protein